jgi:hypothetical protein
MSTIKIMIILWLAGLPFISIMLKHPQKQKEMSARLFWADKRDTIKPAKLLTKADADHILGEPTHLTDSTYKTDEKGSSYLCGYKTNDPNKKDGKTGALYCLFEKYKNTAWAVERYTSVHQANKQHGIEDIIGLGDEAYYHTDGQNFYFIMVREGKYVFNIKVNKITSTTSLNEFKKTARKIVTALQ